MVTHIKAFKFIYFNSVWYILHTWKNSGFCTLYMCSVFFCSMCLDTKQSFQYVVTVTDGKRPGVSGPIGSVKIYSYAQCTTQKRSVCCRDVPYLAHMEQGPGPSTLSTHPPPPSLSAWVLGTQSTSSSQQGWTWTVQWTLASSPTQNL